MCTSHRGERDRTKHFHQDKLQPSFVGRINLAMLVTVTDVDTKVR